MNLYFTTLIMCLPNSFIGTFIEVSPFNRLGGAIEEKEKCNACYYFR